MTGAALTGIAASGCLGWWRNPETPEGVNVETLHRGTNAVDDDEVRREFDMRSAHDAHVELIMDDQSGEQRLHLDEDTAQFLQETDFDEAYVLVVIAGLWPGRFTLSLNRLERVDSGFHLVIESEEPSGDIPVDESLHSLLIRITDEQDGIPQRVELTMDGEDVEPMEPEVHGDE